jgi:hypothetical protein
MKQIIPVFRAALLIAVLASLAACSGGTFFDPGHLDAGALGGLMGGDDWDGGDWDDDDGGGGGKPAELSSSASYNDAVNKLNEIIDYCDDHPGTVNNTIKTGAQAYKTTIGSYQSNWSGMRSAAVTAINTYIGQLQ